MTHASLKLRRALHLFYGLFRKIQRIDAGSHIELAQCCQPPTKKNPEAANHFGVKLGQRDSCEAIARLTEGFWGTGADQLIGKTGVVHFRDSQSEVHPRLSDGDIGSTTIIGGEETLPTLAHRHNVVVGELQVFSECLQNVQHATGGCWI